MPQTIHRTLSNRCKILAIFLLALLLSACSSPASQPTASSPTAPATAITLPTAPESTPTNPPATAKVVLVSGQNDAQTQALQTALQELAGQNGAEFETRASLAPGDAQPGWQVVVLAAPQDNLAEIAGAAPETQFVVVSQADVQQMPGNVSAIRVHKENEAFAAGFISVVISNDWRAAGLLPSDTPLGATINDAYRNGGGYYCGRCVPLLSPFVRFPVPVSLPAASPLSDWQNVANQLSQSVVYTLYVDGQVSSPDLLYDLGSKGYILFGGQTPRDEVRPRWALTLQTDVITPLKDMWPGLLQGQGGQTASAGLTFADVDPKIFTPGKQQLVERMLADLTKGYINPFNP